jgi:MoaA/NifB/PqqE/SkfB family radical SAM enzyme
MFGITNACNLSCDFCSRDVARKSKWSVASAFEALFGLSEAGTLEVAFGGGEPFAFRGFAELVAKLRNETPLALHVTTNGTLLTDDVWPAFANRFGQVRLSIYDDSTWRRCAKLFAKTGQRWGLNLLVEDSALDSLAARLEEFAKAGCHDVSILSYVGEAKERSLSAAGRQQLADILKDSPVPCRLSVCMGDSVPIDRLFAGIDNDGDCGAGYDFISITPDQAVQSCSFQEHSVPAKTAEEILSAWSLKRARFAQPSPRRGCARELPLWDSPKALPPIAIWQGFSGNNSGECILVAKFSTSEDAERYLADVIPGFATEQSYSPEWKALFAKERVATPLMNSEYECEMPAELSAIGSSVIAIGYGLGDNFPELRSLAWKRGAFVVPGGIHVHDSTTALLAVRAKSSDDVRVLAASHPQLQTYPHGDVLLATIPIGTDDEQSVQTLDALKQFVTELAGHRKFSLELFYQQVGADAMIEVKKHLATEPAQMPRLWVSLSASDLASGTNAASAFAKKMNDQHSTVVGPWLLFDRVRGRKRLAVMAYREGASVQPLEGESIQIAARYWVARASRNGGKAKQRSLDIEDLQEKLERYMPAGQSFALHANQDDYYHSSRVVIRCSDPAPVLLAVGRVHDELGCMFSVHASDIDPLAWSVRRILKDIGR